MSEGQAIANSIRSKQEELSPEQINLATEAEQNRARGVAPRTPGVKDEQFPTASLRADEPSDDLYDAKLRLQTEPGVTPFGQLQASDADFMWLQRKQQAAEYANFQKWFADEFDRMSPAQKKIAKELFPRFYTERQQLLDKQVQNLRKYASIKLNGIQSREDLLTMYMAETGRLDIGPLKNILHPVHMAEEEARNHFKRGLLNPRRYVFGDEGALLNEGYTARRRRNATNFAQRTYVDDRLNAGYSTGFPPYGPAAGPDARIGNVYDVVRNQ